MFLFVKMDSNFTSGLLCRHSRLVVAESDLEFIMWNQRTDLYIF